MLKKNQLSIITIFVIFFLDRLSKIYILNFFEMNLIKEFYIAKYVNLYLIWNKGIAFGLFSYEGSFIYNIITIVILMITAIIMIMILRNSGFVKYSLILIFGGSLGNLYDRIFFSAVPDFIDIHINNFHWFIFNVADIFITIGVICLIYAEIFFNNKKQNENSF
jgi:signal peptidase II